MGWGSERHTKANGVHNSLYSPLLHLCTHCGRRPQAPDGTTSLS